MWKVDSSGMRTKIMLTQRNMIGCLAWMAVNLMLFFRLSDCSMKPIISLKIDRTGKFTILLSSSNQY